VETSRIVCTVSLNPIENLSPEETRAFYDWFYHTTGRTPEEFHRKPGKYQQGMILRWLSTLSFMGARIGFKILALPSNITLS
jgi:hypothetical protein